MIGLGQRIKRQRRELGLTQAQVAGQGGVSLATIQNLEAGRANPSYDVLGRILDCIGMELTVRKRSVDWNVLSALGLPLAPQTSLRLRPDGRALAHHLRLAIREVSSPSCDGRRLEATTALLMALRDHYPSFFKNNFARSPTVNELLSGEVAGPLLKLRRIALARISEYL